MAAETPLPALPSITPPNDRGSDQPERDGELSPDDELAPLLTPPYCTAGECFVQREAHALPVHAADDRQPNVPDDDDVRELHGLGSMRTHRVSCTALEGRDALDAPFRRVVRESVRGRPAGVRAKLYPSGAWGNAALARR